MFLIGSCIPLEKFDTLSKKNENNKNTNFMIKKQQKNVKKMDENIN